MDKFKIINNIKDLYHNGGNIISYLKEIDNRTTNSIEDIMISYDFQAGSYNSLYKQHPEKYTEYHQKIARFINDHMIDKESTLLEAGIGEATTLAPVLNILDNKPKKCYGFDISWSRIKCGQQFVKSTCNYPQENINLFVADLFNIPLKDSSIDIVYTAHAIEPNGGNEQTILKELYRVTNKYLILFEPAYEFASEEAKSRMLRNGYITNLYEAAIGLGYQVVKYELLGVSLNPLNPTGVMIIEKHSGEKSIKPASELCCPVSKGDLKEEKGAFFCSESLLAYPVIDNIPCLMMQNAILATKFDNSFE